MRRTDPQLRTSLEGVVVSQAFWTRVNPEAQLKALHDPATHCELPLATLQTVPADPLRRGISTTRFGRKIFENSPVLAVGDVGGVDAASSSRGEGGTGGARSGALSSDAGARTGVVDDIGRANESGLIDKGVRILQRIEGREALTVPQFDGSLRVLIGAVVEPQLLMSPIPQRTPPSSCRFCISIAALTETMEEAARARETSEEREKSILSRRDF